MFLIQDMTCRKAQGYLQKSPPLLSNLKQNVREGIRSMMVSKISWSDAWFLGFHVPWSWQASPALLRTILLGANLIIVWPKEERNDQKWWSIEIVIWSDCWGAGTFFVSEEDGEKWYWFVISQKSSSALARSVMTPQLYLLHFPQGWSSGCKAQMPRKKGLSPLSFWQTYGT